MPSESMSLAEGTVNREAEDSCPLGDENRSSHCQENETVSDGCFKANGFVSARTLVSEAQLMQSSKDKVDLSPGFRSAAAMAGWDDDALLLAAMEDNCPPLQTQDESLNTPEARAGRVGCRDRCGRCGFCMEKKREVRTPGQASTPLSANRRRRRPRRHSGNEVMPELPLEALTIHNVPGDEHLDNSIEVQKTPITAEIKASEFEKENSNSELLEDGSTGMCSKLPHLDQLKDELSCAVCLEICCEPSTTSCGHSFCRICLQSVIQKCGPRCPKCRKALRSDAVKPCSINTVLWNTIQILFPDESSRRSKEKPELLEEPKSNAQCLNTMDSTARAARASSWRNTVVRASFSGLSRSRPIGNFRRPSQTVRASSHTRQIVSSDEELDPEIAQSQRANNNFSQERREGNRVGRRERQLQAHQQELMDAALASRLQAAELLQANSVSQNVIDLENELDRFQNLTEQRHQTLSSATANLRTMASRTARHRSRQ